MERRKDNRILRIAICRAISRRRLGAEFGRFLREQLLSGLPINPGEIARQLELVDERALYVEVGAVTAEAQQQFPKISAWYGSICSRCTHEFAHVPLPHPEFIPFVVEHVLAGIPVSLRRMRTELAIHGRISNEELSDVLLGCVDSVARAISKILDE